MRLSSKLFASVALGALTALPVVTPVFAQVGEIVVTTRKRAESLQDAPVSVTAFTAETIARQGISNVRELASQVPGFNLQEGFGRRDERPAVRGLTTIGTPDFGVESGTAIFVDGVFVNTDTTAFGLSDLERVEFVRGPQSALYGRNAYAGAINFITKTPGDEFEFNGNARFAENAEWEVTGRVAGPLVPGKLSGSINARHYEYGGEFTNPENGQKVGDQETNSVAGALFFDAGTGFTAKARVAYWQDKDGPRPDVQIEQVDFGANAFAPFDTTLNYNLVTFAPFNATPRNTYFQGELPILDLKPIEVSQVIPIAPPGMERETFIGTFRADQDLFDGYTATFLAGYRNENRAIGFDASPGNLTAGCDAGTVGGSTLTNINFGGTCDALLLHLIDLSGALTDELSDAGIEFIGGSTQETEEMSFEVRFASPEDERFHWMVGGFYYNIEILPFDLFRKAIDTDGARETDNWAVFGLGEFNVTDQLSGTLEMRYAEDKKSVTGEFVSSKQTFTSFNPKFTLKYLATDDISLYASVAKGNKPGGFNDQNNLVAAMSVAPIGGNPAGSIGGTGYTAVFTTGTPTPTFKEETSWVYEIGAKTSWFDNRMTVNASIFFADIKDAQLTNTFTVDRFDTLANAIADIGADASGNSQIVNLDKLESYGGEIEIQAAPTEDLFLTLGYAYVNPEIKKGGTIDQFNLFGDASVAGNIMPRVSQHELNWSGEWRREIPDYGFEFFVNINGSYESKRFVQVHNLAEFGEATVLNTRLGIDTEHYTLAFFVKNLTDEDAYADVLRFRDVVIAGDRVFNANKRRGRQVGVEASVNF